MTVGNFTSTSFSPPRMAPGGGPSGPPVYEVETWADRPATPAPDAEMIVATVGNLKDVRFKWLGSAWSAKCIYDMLQAFPSGTMDVARHAYFPFHSGALDGTGFAATKAMDGGASRAHLPSVGSPQRGTADGLTHALMRVGQSDNFRATSAPPLGSGSAGLIIYGVVRWSDTGNQFRVGRIVAPLSASPRFISIPQLISPIDGEPRVLKSEVNRSNGVDTNSEVETANTVPADQWCCYVSTADFAGGQARAQLDEGVEVSIPLESSGVVPVITSVDLSVRFSGDGGSDFRAFGVLDFSASPDAGVRELIAALLRPIRDFGA